MLRITKSNRDHFKAISRSFFRSLLVRKIQSLFLFAENSNKNLKTNRLVYKIGKLSSIQKQLSMKSCSEDMFFIRHITTFKVSMFGVTVVRIFPYSVWMRKNADQNNSAYGHFSRSLFSCRIRKIFQKSLFVEHIWASGNKVAIPKRSPTYSLKTNFLEYVLEKRLHY